MQNNEAVYYEDIADLIDEIDGKATAADLHGMVCGELAAGMAAPDDAWLKACLRYLDTSNLPSGAAKRELILMRDQSFDLLQDEQLSFAMLLPDENVELCDRAEALGQWCKGFINGFAVAEKLGGRDFSKVEDLQEILADFAAVAEIDSDDDDDSDEAENDFMQLTEYVKMAVLTVFALCSVEPPSGAKAGPATIH